MTEQSMINIKIKFTSSIKTNNNRSENIIIIYFCSIWILKILMYKIAILIWILKIIL